MGEGISKHSTRSKQVSRKPFCELHDVGFCDKCHFYVNLGELGLAVAPQVFIAEAAHDLKVAIITGDHEQLFVGLRRLGQGVEVASLNARWDEIISRAFGRAFS